MDEAGAAAVLPGPSQPAFCRSGAPERRTRKSGSANIFQGVNLRQLRRLFHSAGEPDAEQRARQVWGSRRGGEGEGEDGGGGDAEDEEELAQALVGLRVRARTRSGMRAESGRGVRPFGHSRTNERTSTDAASSDDDASSGACGGSDPLKAKEEEDPPGAPRKDPDRYLHRIRH
ncbi:arginine vasopressin-induced protein 1 [Trichomycterus rosablanca]|uniref:arginine vasopressin-induced protein 1 n=1 Tax=Trichomycterus rosablanca TaxID=2290929 RepID=UPI002F351B24